jgi:hypothetical protein
MTHYLKPRNDQARLTALEWINQRGRQDQLEGIEYLHPNTLGQIEAFIPQFAAALDTCQSQDSARMNAVTEARTAIEAVANHIRAIWSVVKRRTRLDGLPVAVQLYYGLPANGRNPSIGSQNEWLTQADRIIQGEAEAVAAGYPALLEPNVAELQTLLDAARTAVSQREAAKAAYDAAVVTRAALRAQANELIKQAMAELRLALRQETAPHRREIMRGYGAHFSQETTETPALSEAEVAAADEPAAATTPVSEPAAMGMPQLTPASNGTAVHV